MPAQLPEWDKVELNTANTIDNRCSCLAMVDTSVTTCICSALIGYTQLQQTHRKLRESLMMCCYSCTTGGTHAQVKAVKGLLVISTAIQDSRRSVNQLQGRAGRQGDPGETLTFYDFNDVVLQGDATVAMTGSEHPLMFCLLFCL